MTLADALSVIAGASLLVCGAGLWWRRPGNPTGPLAALCGAAWFAGDALPVLVFAHRGPLAHLLLAYPDGRLRSLTARATVAVAYASAVPALGRSDILTIVLWSAVAVLAVLRYRAATGAQRPARAVSAAVTLPVAAVLVASAAARLGGSQGDHAELVAYELAVAVAAGTLLIGAVRGRWAAAAVAGLVVELGSEPAAPGLRDRLARAVGDSSLEIAYWLPDDGSYVDDHGRPVELPDTRTGRAVTVLEHPSGGLLAALIHDPAALDDPELIKGATAAARVAIANARTRARTRTGVREVQESRRRIIHAVDRERLRLESQLRDATDARLTRVHDLLADCGGELAGAAREVNAARAEVRGLALGIHPAGLERDGLGAALEELAARSPVPVVVQVPSDLRLDGAAATAAYFVCAEALANMVKHAGASSARVVLSIGAGRTTLEISDDGVGGADPMAGSGLRGLADRVEALGGHLSIHSPANGGTTLVAELPAAEG